MRPTGVEPATFGLKDQGFLRLIGSLKRLRVIQQREGKAEGKVIGLSGFGKSNPGLPLMQLALADRGSRACRPTAPPAARVGRPVGRQSASPPGAAGFVRPLASSG